MRPLEKMEKIAKNGEGQQDFTGPGVGDLIPAGRDHPAHREGPSMGSSWRQAFGVSDAIRMWNPPLFPYARASGACHSPGWSNPARCGSTPVERGLPDDCAWECHLPGSTPTRGTTPERQGTRMGAAL